MPFQAPAPRCTWHGSPHHKISYTTYTIQMHHLKGEYWVIYLNNNLKSKHAAGAWARDAKWVWGGVWAFQTWLRSSPARDTAYSIHVYMYTCILYIVYTPVTFQVFQHKQPYFVASFSLLRLFACNPAREREEPPGCWCNADAAHLLPDHSKTPEF